MLYLLLSFSFLINNEPNINEVRNLLLSESDYNLDSFLEDFENHKNKSSLHLAYYGFAMALKAKESINPYTKLKSLKTFNTSLEEAVSLDPENIEIRLLRLSVNSQIPEFLQNEEVIESDKKAICNQTANNRNTLNITVLKYFRKAMTEQIKKHPCLDWEN